MRCTGERESDGYRVWGMSGWVGGGWRVIDRALAAPFSPSHREAKCNLSVAEDVIRLADEFKQKRQGRTTGSAESNQIAPSLFAVCFIGHKVRPTPPGSILLSIIQLAQLTKEWNPFLCCYLISQPGLFVHFSLSLESASI